MEVYFEYFRREYNRLTNNPQVGAGFPAVGDHPALDNSTVECLIGTDGCIICDYSDSPSYDWQIAGGPAIMIDEEPTRVPSHIVDRLKSEGIYGKPIGIYRVVPKTKPTRDVWHGILPKRLEFGVKTTKEGKKFLDIALETILNFCFPG